jgi:hypothetical protein
MNTKRKSLTEQAITENLGYCCMWAFFFWNKRTGMIALRLGLSTRTIRSYKEKFNNGEFSCEGTCKCMREKLKRNKL